MTLSIWGRGNTVLTCISLWTTECYSKKGSKYTLILPLQMKDKEVLVSGTQGWGLGGGCAINCDTESWPAPEPGPHPFVTVGPCSGWEMDSILILSSASGKRPVRRLGNPCGPLLLNYLSGSIRKAQCLIMCFFIYWFHSTAGPELTGHLI